MRGKRSKTLSIRLCADERQALQARAEAEGRKLSDLLRDRLTPLAAAPALSLVQEPSSIEVFHIDELGSDDLRAARNGALRK